MPNKSTALKNCPHTLTCLTKFEMQHMRIDPHQIKVKKGTHSYKTDIPIKGQKRSRSQMQYPAILRQVF